MRNALTVDVEDYFQVSAFADVIDRADWDAQPPRVEDNTNHVMDLLAEHDTKGTFFVLGWVAERYPEIVRRMVAEGHEVACHGYNHRRVSDQSADEFREDIRRTRGLLEGIAGVPVIGYRAASFSISAATPWAHEVLASEGFRYSSSIYPIHHDHYGSPDAGRYPYAPANTTDFIEIPITTVEVLGQRLPSGGGGYFRLLPYWWSRWAWRRVNERDRAASLFYFHPWEVDPGQPHIKGVSRKTAFRHYVNLARTENKISKALTDFDWGRMDDIFLAPSTPPEG
jgi:polysaccharide deacetylase family protein (PEP-CTERM system associated)